jgi:V/A-type H+-transporting ATPase subunit I
MAIAKMKKLTLLAEQEKKESVLRAVQEMQSVEMIPLSEVVEEELVEQFSFSDKQQESAELTERLQDIEHSLSYIRQYVPQPGLIEQLKSKREVYSLDELEAHVESLDIDQLIGKIQEKEKAFIQIQEERKELQEEESFLRKWRNISFLPQEVSNFKMMHVTVGSIDSEQAELVTNELDELGTAYYEEIYRTTDDVALLIVLPKNEKDTFSKLASRTSFRELRYPYDTLPEDALYENLNQQKELREKVAAMKDEMKEWKQEVKDLELTEEYYYNIHERETAKELLMNSSHLFLISGWIEEEKVETFTQAIHEVLGEENVAILSDDIKMKEYADVPIVLKNNKFVEPFEMITEMFSYPKYNEKDPTPFLYPFFMLFFGMMSADAGYGLLLFGATLAVLKAFNLEGGMERMAKFLHQLSYPTIIFGLFFGSFFGAELPFAVFTLQEDVIEIMIMAVILGVIQLLTALILNGVIKLTQQERASAYIDGFAWFLILIGIILYVVGEMVVNQPMLAQAGIILALINVVGILLASTIASKNKALGFGLGLYNLYGVTGYVGDIVSYTRLMALAVASANIAMAFNLIVGLLPPMFRFTIGIFLMIALHGLNIALTFLGGYVHTIRLQYVEFFGKFYEGGGRPLKPLKTLEKYIWLEEKK